MSDLPNDKPKMRRGPFAAWLTAQGYPIKPATLAKYATVGGGPEYELFGRIPLYTPAKGLSWARSRCRVKRSTSDPGQPLAAG
jgi:hypothetical protein